jgi:hypothetical protein
MGVWLQLGAGASHGLMQPEPARDFHQDRNTTAQNKRMHQHPPILTFRATPLQPLVQPFEPPPYHSIQLRFLSAGYGS